MARGLLQGQANLAGRQRRAAYKEARVSPKAKAETPRAVVAVRALYFNECAAQNAARKRPQRRQHASLGRAPCKRAPYHEFGELFGAPRFVRQTEQPRSGGRPAGATFAFQNPASLFAGDFGPTLPPALFTADRRPGGRVVPDGVAGALATAGLPTRVSSAEGQMRLGQVARSNGQRMIDLNPPCVAAAPSQPAPTQLRPKNH